MRLIAPIIRALREFDEALEHARTGRAPERLRRRPAPPAPAGRNCHET